MSRAPCPSLSGWTGRRDRASEPVGAYASPRVPIEVPTMAAACRFCQIVAGDAPAFRVMEDQVVMAFLDIRPLFPGHVLVVPREHHETLADLPQLQVAPLFGVVRRLSRVVPLALEAEGTF